MAEGTQTSQFTTGNFPMKSSVITNRSQAGPKFFASVFRSNRMLWLGTGLSGMLLRIQCAQVLALVLFQ